MEEGELELVAEGYTTHVFIDENRKPMNLPEHYLQIFRKLESEA